MRYQPPRLVPAGDSALLVEFGNEISEAVNREVHSLAHALDQHPVPGLREAVPAYCSLLIQYDPLELSWSQVKTAVAQLLAERQDIKAPEPRIVRVPVVYGQAFGPDIEFVAEHNGIRVEEVIRLHSEALYTVYMLGFTPGFAYLGGLAEAIATPRLPTPRNSVPGGSVGIAGSQTGIYAISSPGGWRLVGRTPARLFDATRARPTLLEPGDKVRFVPIRHEDWQIAMEDEGSGT